MLAVVIGAQVQALDRIVANGEGMSLSCAPPSTVELRCDYRINSTADVLGAGASVGAIELPAPQFAAKASNDEPVAILLLVSEALLQHATLRKKVTHHVTQLLAQAPHHHQFGLATYGGAVKVIAPLGTSADLISSKLAGESPSAGQALLYRATVQAAQLLAGTSTQRRAIVVLSSGTSDDRQLDPLQAVREARNRAVVVYALGYPLPRSDSLRQLRALCEQTGGGLIAANEMGDISEDQLSQPFAGLDNTGALQVNLSSAFAQLDAGEHLVTVAIDTAAGPASSAVPVYFPGASATSARLIELASTTSTATANDNPNVVTAPPRRRGPPEFRVDETIVLWTLAVVALALLALLGWLISRLILRRRRGASERVARATPSQRAATPGSAYLMLRDLDGRSHRISSPVYTIGRLGNNDLVLDDPSVSRHHAEIRRARDGSFSIVDLDSMNGIYVNGRRTRGCALDDGDELEIGDARLSFELTVDDPLDRESTALLDTAAIELEHQKRARARQR